MSDRNSWNMDKTSTPNTHIQDQSHSHYNILLEILWSCQILISHIMFHIYIHVYSTFRRLLVMVFNATFNNISVISWQSVLLVEETEVSEENHGPAVCYWQTYIEHFIIVYWIEYPQTKFPLFWQRETLSKSMAVDDWHISKVYKCWLSILSFLLYFKT
jgi:hypothetical protein